MAIVSDLVVTKTVDDATPAEGNTITYTVTLTNQGPSEGTGIQVTDLLPSGVTFVSATASPGTYTAGTGLWDVGSLVLGASGTLDLDVTVDMGTAGSTITNTASVTALDQTDPLSTNDTDSADITVESADLSVSKIVNNATPAEGDTVTYTVTLTNGGPADATGIEVTDVLPSGVTFVSAAPNLGTYTAVSGLWDVGNLASMSNGTLDLQAAVNAGTGGSVITNTASVTKSNPADPVISNNSGSVNITVLVVAAEADLSISKTVDDPTPAVGDTIVYTVTLTNEGPDAGSGIEVTDDLPSGVTFVSASSTQGSYDAGTGLWDVGNLSTGASDTLLLEVKVDAGTGGSTITNTASVTGANETDPVSGNNTDSVDINVQIQLQVANLAVTKTVNDATPAEGDTIVYRVRLTNQGPNGATSVTLTDSLPSGVTFLSASLTQGTYDEGTGLWDVGSLSTGASDTLALEVTVDGGTGGATITNTASISSSNQSDPVSGNNTDTVDITVEDPTPVANLDVTKTVNDATPAQGDTISYTVTLLNEGPDAATGVELTDVLPSGVTFVSATPSQGTYDDGTGLWDVGSLDADSTRTLVLDAKVDAGTGGSTITNTASVTASDQADPQSNNNSDSVNITVENSLQVANLAVTKTVNDATPAEGDTIVYRVRLTNQGPNGATSVTLTDSLPSGVTFLSASVTQGTYNEGTGLWDVGSLSTGASDTLALEATVDGGTGGATITNTASISSSNQSDPVSGNNTDTVDITVEDPTPVANLDVTKTVNDATPAQGDTISYTVTLLNEGPDAATGIELTDVLPSGVTFLSATPSQGTYDDGTGLWDVGSLDADSTRTLVLDAKVNAGTGGSTITNTASVTASDQADPQSNNNSDSVNITVQNSLQVANLAVTKTVDDATPAEGDTIVYRVRLTNQGPNGATSVTLTDSLPSGVTFLSASVTQGTYNEGTGLWDVGSLSTGASDTLALEATVDGGTGGATITNTASISSSNQSDPVTGNNTDTVDITVEDPTPVANLDVTKTVNDTTPAEGDTISYRVTLLNEGPDAATGIELTDVLPSGVTFVSATLSQGTYDDGTGLWDIGSLDPDSTRTLVLDVSLDEGTGGAVITNTASVTAADQSDSQSNNNSDSADVTVQGPPQVANLAVVKVVDESEPTEGDTVRYTVTLTNNGPDPATGVEVTDLLPSGLTFVLATQSGGTYDSDTGLWDVGSLAAGSRDTLMLEVTVDAGTGGSTITNTASVTAAFQIDPVSTNDSDSVDLMVQSADLAILKTVDDATPFENDSITYTITLTNEGPDPATGIRITDLLPIGVQFDSAVLTHGTYDPQTGSWDVGTLDADSSATLGIGVTVGLGSGGSTITNTASVVASDQVDPESANDSDGVDIHPRGRMHVTSFPQTDRTFLPGSAPFDVYRFELANRTSEAETLTTIVFTNGASGPGTQNELDASWGQMAIGLEGSGEVLTSSSFISGNLRLEDLSVEIPASDTLVLVLTGSASRTARDGDVLDLLLSGPGDLAFTRSVPLEASWPLDPDGTFDVDGMSAAQITLYPIGAADFKTAAKRDLVLDFVVPANGYEEDELETLRVVNLGSAEDGTDLEVMEVWVDDGDAVFDAASDRLLGALSPTGGEWVLTGLRENVPVSGLHVFMTANIATEATEGRTVRIGLPTGFEPGLRMASGNDGPLDAAVENPQERVITANDRITLTAASVQPGSVRPGQKNVLLLQVVATNSYMDDKKLTQLKVTNTASTRPGTSEAQRDDLWVSLALRLDGDNNGVLGDAVTDPLLGTAFFTGGKADFSGLDWDLAAGATKRLFLTGEVSLSGVADRDTLSAHIIGSLDVLYQNPTTIVASWPLDSGARWVVDGMVSAQVANLGAPAATLGPGDGPVLALDLVLPDNGYAPDVLEGLEVRNAGTAGQEDLAELRAWRDGGDGLFTPGSGDDVEIAQLLPFGAGWRSPLVSESLGATGLRLFVGVTVSDSPSDSATVRLEIPLLGIAVGSDNDGPVDQAIRNSQTLLLSSELLLANLTVEEDASTVNQNVTVRMDVRNGSSEAIDSITPTALESSGDGTLVLVSGPSPASMDLPADASGNFMWIYRAAAVGDVQLSGTAEGTETTSGLTRRALRSQSNTHRVLAQADRLLLSTLQSMPTSVNRGQTDVVPLSLTFSHEGAPDESRVLVRRVKIRLEDPDVGGIVPNELLSRIVVREGTTAYLSLTELPTAGSEVDLVLDSPVTVAGGEAVTVSIRLDILGTTQVPAFRVAILGESWFTVEDETNGSGIPVQLQEQSYPVQSRVGRLSEEPTRLDVSKLSGVAQRVSRGQENVSLLDIRLQNPGNEGLTSDIRVGALSVFITDEFGVQLYDRATSFERIRVTQGAQVLHERPVTSNDDSLFSLDLSRTPLVAANTTTDLMISADLAPDARLGNLRLRLGDPSHFDARDANSGAKIDVVYATGIIDGETVTVEAHAETLLVRGEALFPNTLVVGETDVSAIRAELRHPGAPGVGRIHIQTLKVLCSDGTGAELSPTRYIERLRVLQEGIEIASLANIPSSGAMTLTLANLLLDQGEMAALTLVVDVEGDAPTNRIELLIEASGIEAVDANTSISVFVEPESGPKLLLSSGLTHLKPRAGELVVGLEGRMPAVLVADESWWTLANITLANTAEEGSGSIEIDHLVLRALTSSKSPLDLGRVVTKVEAWANDALWAESGDLSQDSVTAHLRPAELEILDPGDLELELRVLFRPDVQVDGFRVGIDQLDIGVRQPEANPVRVVTASGQSFPLHTEVGHFSGVSLQDSYVNFPNPFAAGREQTRFAYYLRTSARVSLRVLTPRGEIVRVLLANVDKDPGLHQIDTWDGRNGRGAKVLNGIYLAELIVSFADGSRERILRKVAVVR